MDNLVESQGMQAAAVGHAVRREFRILNVFSFPVLVLSRDGRVMFANRAAGDTFGIGRSSPADTGFFQEIQEVSRVDTVKNLARGQSAVVEVSFRDRRQPLVAHRLDESFGDDSYVLSFVDSSGGERTSESAIRRMKHRFNNYLAPMAGKAEIILFALKKGNYNKVEKAANDIVRHAEDSEALDALFDPEPGQESQSITYYVT